jgi:carbonic anhydrase/acetyltransferase-like protein (isoleucine patch superfamily)
VDSIALGDLPCCRTSVVAMDVKVLLIVGEGASGHSESLGGVPIPLLDVLGASVLERVISRLERLGITAVSVVTTVEQSLAGSQGNFRPDLQWVQTEPLQLWRAAAHTLSEYCADGADLIFAIRLGNYAEIDYEEFVQSHLDQKGRVTVARKPNGEFLDAVIISGGRRNEGMYLLRNMLRDFRTPCKWYTVFGYVQPLLSATDIRQLAVDAFQERNSIRPIGTEIRPGVWVGEGARIHRKARVLAPAFIGSRSKVRAAAVVTRGSVLEHHSEVDCGTVVENSTILPYAYLGAGLDLTHSVLIGENLHNIPRAITVEIRDVRLIRSVSRNAASRTLASAFELAAYLPRALALSVQKSLADRNGNHSCLESTPAALNATDQIHEPANPETSDTWVPARRYGNE